MPESKAIVITGASAGIGAATARHLASLGHSVVLAARRQTELDALAAELGRAVAVVTDVRQRADVERLRDEAIRAFGHVDVWINNAGRGITRPTLELTDADVDEMMSANLKSVLYGMQAIVPHFVARGRGHVINVSSVLGRVPIAPVRSAYAAAKAALNSLTANVRMDLAPHPHVHVTLVMPGLVSTGFAANTIGAAPPSGAPRPAWTPPPGLRPQTPEEVARAIAAVVERPVAEVFTNPASADLAREYYQDIGAFERRLRS